MRKQGLTIAALIIAIIGLSIGFAAFSNTLTISQSASVDPSGTNMNVVWSSSNSDAETDSIVPTKSPNNVTGFTATSASITGADYRTLSGVSAAFTAPGQSVTYELYVYNNGTYTAYLTNLVMGSKTCTATPQQNSEDEATEELVSAACNDISMTVEIGTSELTASGSLENQTLAPGASVAATVTLTYANNNHYVDGPMTVTFGSTTFEASTVAAQVVQVDDLIPTAEQLINAGSPIDEDGGTVYYFVDLYCLNDVDEEECYTLNYTVEDRTVGMLVNDEIFMFRCTDKLWYKVEWNEEEESLQPVLYDGLSPVSASTFANGTVKDTDYLTRVINSFGQ